MRGVAVVQSSFWRRTSGCNKMLKSCGADWFWFWLHLRNLWPIGASSASSRLEIRELERGLGRSSTVTCQKVEGTDIPSGLHLFSHHDACHSPRGRKPTPHYLPKARLRSDFPVPIRERSQTPVICLWKTGTHADGS